MNKGLTVTFRFATYFVVFLIIGLFSVLDSCKEDTGGVGANVLPKNDLISAYQTDTTTLLTSMYVKDSVITTIANPTMLGSYSDPIFGQAKSSIYTLVSSPSGTVAPWADSGTVDSAILILPFYIGNGNYYGNLDPQTVVVDTLENYLVSGKAYYSDTSIKSGPVPIAMQLVTPPNPEINDSIRIRLSNSWMKYIVSATTNKSTYYYPSFDSLVKGLYITVSNPFQFPGQGGIWYINLNGSFAGIYLYYHYSSSPTTVQQPAIFPVGATWFTHIDKNYSTSAFYNVHPSGKHDSIPANNLIYVQSMGGVTGRINFPNLYKNWSKLRPVLINEAEIDLSVDAQDASAPFLPPSSLVLVGTNSAGQPYDLPDLSEPYYGGYYNGFNYTYPIVITQYIQDVIDGKDTDRGLFIAPGAYGNTPNRVVLYGAQHGEVPTNQRMKLKIYYTPLKQP